jgi:hypothetical protein
MLPNQYFYEQWHKARIDAGIEEFIPHDLRRSANRNLKNGHIQGIPHRRHGLEVRQNRKAVRNLRTLKPLRCRWKPSRRPKTCHRKPLQEKPTGGYLNETGAGSEDRTRDLKITNLALYQLSYPGGLLKRM